MTPQSADLWKQFKREFDLYQTPRSKQQALAQFYQTGKGATALARVQQSRQAVANQQGAFRVAHAIDPQTWSMLNVSQQHDLLAAAIRQNVNQMTQHLAQQQAQMIMSQAAARSMSRYNTSSTQTAAGTGYGGWLGNINVVTSAAVPPNSVFITNFGGGGGGTASTGNSIGQTAGTGPLTWVNDADWVNVAPRLAGKVKVYDGQACQIELPDGAVLDVKKDGSYTIADKDAKVTYRANRVRDFNRFMNVSDRLEEFVKFCGAQGVHKEDMLVLPLKLFVAWLVIEAAKADKTPPPAEVKLLPDLRKAVTPRCPGCGKFLPHYAQAIQVPFCAPPCFERHYNRMVPSPPLLPGPELEINQLEPNTLPESLAA